MPNSQYTANATIPVGGAYDSSLYILGNTFPDNTQEIIPLLTDNQFKSLVIPISNIGYKIYNATVLTMYSWNGTNWGKVNNATSSNLVANTTTGQTIINISSTAPPVAGQALVAISETEACWSNVSGGGGGGGDVASFSTLIGDGTSTTINVTHGLGTESIVCGVWETTGALRSVACTVSELDNNRIALHFTTAPALHAYKVVVLAAGSSGGGGSSNWGSIGGTLALQTDLVSALATKQASSTKLTTLSSLADASGWLHNNGSGTLTYSIPTAINVGAEAALGTPSTNGYILSSTTSGIRSWIAPSGGTGTGTVTSVTGTGTVNGLTLSGTVTNSGSLTLGGTITGFEPSLGNPGTNGYILSSTISGTRSWIAPPMSLSGTGFVKVSGTTISYDNSTYYLASNPSGYTNNIGTVTSISGTGTISGLTLSGTVTNSGSLTLSGTITGFEPSLGNPGTDGYVLSSTVAGVRSWIAPSSGSSGSAWNFFDPDLLPAIPSAYDDEFDGTSLDSKWTRVNNGVVWTLYDVGITTPGILTVNSSTGSGQTLEAILQPLPAGDFSIFVKSYVQITDSGQQFFSGLILSSTNTAGTGSQLVLGNSSYGGTTYMQGYQWSNFNSYGSGGTPPGIYNTPEMVATYATYRYLRIRRSGTTYYGAGSIDGSTWIEWTLPSPGATPVYCGLMNHNASSVHYWDKKEFFRYFPSATATLGGTRTVGGSGVSSGTVWSFFDPEQAPISPSTLDDDFSTSGTIGSGWTQVNFGTLSSSDVSITAPSALWMSQPANQPQAAAVKALPAGDFSAFTQINLEGIDQSYIQGGLILSDTNTTGTGNQAILSLNYNGGWRRSCNKTTSFNGFASTLWDAPGRGPAGFLRMRRSGSNYYVATSLDGETWYEASVSPGFTPNYIGIYIKNEVSSGANLFATFKFFRFYSSATATLGGVRSI